MSRNSKNAAGPIVIGIAIIGAIVYWAAHNILGILGIILFILGLYGIKKQSQRFSRLTLGYASFVGAALAFSWFVFHELWNTIGCTSLLSFIAAILITIGMAIKRKHIWKRWAGAAVSTLVLTFVGIGNVPTVQPANNLVHTTFGDIEQTPSSQTAAPTKSTAAAQATTTTAAAPAVAKPVQQNTATSSTGRIQAKVIKDVDGDTIKVQIGNKEETVRFLLVDTPETHHPSKPVQPYGPEAAAFTKSMVDGKTVELERDISDARDKYGRLLYYVYVDGKSVQEALLQKGLARVAYVYPPNVKYVDKYRAIQSKAQKAGVGIWSIENYVQADGFHPANNQSTATQNITVAKAPTVHKPAPVLKKQPVPAGVKILSVTSPAPRNSYATLTARVTPGATASIEVDYKSGPSTAQGLEDKTADENGNVSWTWKVGGRTTIGSWPITVSCNGVSQSTEFEVVH